MIAIDGPASSGKGTVAAFLAKELQYMHVDSGLFYRYFARFYKETCEDTSVVGALAAQLLAQPTAEVVKFFEPVLEFFYQKSDHAHIIPVLKTESCAQVASKISTEPNVRQCVNTAIRSIDKNLVIDGRDTTTVIFPDADVKLFITANVQTRAKRRMWEDETRISHSTLGKNDVPATERSTLQHYVDAIVKRDQQDATRSVAPLICPEDAIVVDTSEMNTSQMCEHVMQIVKVRLNIG